MLDLSLVCCSQSARNVIKVIETIHRLLSEDGIWINIGPLQWHFEGTVSKETGEGSIELCLDEVKELARSMGFNLREERMSRTSYSGALESMSIHEYQVSGISLIPIIHNQLIALKTI